MTEHPMPVLMDCNYSYTCQVIKCRLLCECIVTLDIFIWRFSCGVCHIMLFTLKNML